MEGQVGLIGFKCPADGSTHEFSYCIGQCPNKCMSLPLLRAMARQSSVQEKRYSVTEIMNPPRMVYLKRHFAYFANPEQLIWAIFGTAVHSVISAYSGIDPALDGLIVEHKFETMVGDCVLVGKSDLYDTNTKELIDYKTIKTYAVKTMKGGDWHENAYLWQLNLYKTFGHPDAQLLTLECLVKDWSEDSLIRDGVKPIERINVPILNSSLVSSTAQEKIIEHEKNHNDPAMIRPCTLSEVWFNTNPRSKNCGRPLRCDKYCDVCQLCPQYKQFNEADDVAKKNIYPRG